VLATTTGIVLAGVGLAGVLGLLTGLLAAALLLAGLALATLLVLAALAALLARVLWILRILVHVLTLLFAQPQFKTIPKQKFRSFKYSRYSTSDLHRYAAM
jgi:hypothetical protein